MDVYSAIAEPQRRKLIDLLSKRGPMASTAISRNFAITAPAVSQHLKVLESAGLLSKNKKAQKRIYKINPQGFDEIQKWLNSAKKGKARRSKK